MTPLTADEREELIERWIARCPDDQRYYLHNQLMIDYDNITDAGLQALACRRTLGHVGAD